MRLVVWVLLSSCVQRGSLTVRAGDALDPVEETASLVDTDCANPVVLVEPEAEGVHPVDATVRVRLTLPEPEAELRVRTRLADLPGTTVVEGPVLRWAPLGPMPAGAPVELRLTWSCGVESQRWTTAASLVRARIVTTDPERAAFPGLRQLEDPLLGLVAVGGGEVRLRYAAMLGDEIDPCLPTAELQGTVEDARRFVAVGPAELIVRGVGGSVGPTQLLGKLEAGGALSELRLRAAVPVRQLSEADPSEACSRAADLGWTCSACAEGRCVDLDLALQAEEVGSTVLAPRSLTDIASDPACL